MGVLESVLTAVALKQTPLNAVHRRMGGRMVDFGGWDMPVQYPAGTVEEHLRTRTRAGLFDVSHMGEIDVRGADAISFLKRRNEMLTMPRNSGPTVQAGTPMTVKGEGALSGYRRGVSFFFSKISRGAGQRPAATVQWNGART